ncbi:MAG TPA: response regulator [Pyrinomonadaceae bacterium]
MTGTVDTDTHRPNARADAPRRDADAVSGARPCVLVAEDHEDTRFMLRVFLEARGFDVIEAANGEDAIRLSESACPDLILLDGQLPRLDGVGVVSRIRSHDQSRRVPIVFLSGHAEPLARTAAFAAGCDDYLTKPFELVRLASVLRRHLSDGAGPREVSE